MKCIILAAGYGTRLGEKYKDIPKALIEVKGKPILDYIISKINEIVKVDKIIIITNNKFYDKFCEWRDREETKNLTNKKIVIVNNGTNKNEERLGALGDLLFAINAENVNDDLLLIASDNLFDFDLRGLAESSRDVIGVCELPKEIISKKYGVIEIDKNNKIIGFEEKPIEPKTNLASTGIYIFKKETLPLIKKYRQEGHSLEGPGNFIEWLYKQKEVYAYVFKGKWFDIGNLEILEKARKEF